jgi:single-strand DNA-binding protein
LNTVVLVGRLTGNPEVTVTENGKHITKILLAVNRNYKNVDGIYETDFIR